MAEFTDREMLVHRFLDQELSDQERLAFVVQLGRDQSLREQVLELQQLAIDAGRLPRPAVADSFVRNVLDRIEPTPSPWRRLADAVLAPRLLHWNLAGAAAAVCVALVAIGAAMAAGRSWSPAAAPAGPGEGVSAGASMPVLVRLIVLQPGARSVHVAGDFNGWNPSVTPLEPTADGGAWTVMLRLEPGRYEYQFIVDGERWVADPFAAEESDDGFGSRNAVLDVRLPMVGEQVS